jgi:hypothetical protein
MQSGRIGNLRLASQHQHTPPTLVRMAEIGVKYEKEIFDKSPDKVCAAIPTRERSC